MPRPSKVKYFIEMAILVSSRGTCIRRKVGCVLTNNRNHVIATGFNGVHAGAVHCIDKPCKGADAKSGTNLDACEAIHAEQNALLQCHDAYDIAYCYCTTAPCITCVKLLLNTSCKHIYFLEDYPHTNSKTLWENAGRIWKQVKGG